MGPVADAQGFYFIVPQLVFYSQLQGWNNFTILVIYPLLYHQLFHLVDSSLNEATRVTVKCFSRTSTSQKKKGGSRGLTHLQEQGLIWEWIVFHQMRRRNFCTRHYPGPKH